MTSPSPARSIASCSARQANTSACAWMEDYDINSKKIASKAAVIHRTIHPGYALAETIVCILHSTINSHVIVTHQQVRFKLFYV